MKDIGKSSSGAELRVGIVALQGDFSAHARMCRSIGADTVEIRTAADFDGCTHIVLPGGESTTILKLFEFHDLSKSILHAAKSGTPILATCAGVILLAHRITEDGQKSLGLINIEIHRNAYGRQVESFEADLSIPTIGNEPFAGVFIRAPIIASTGNGVDVLSTHRDRPVLVRQGNIIGATFHPELSGDTRLHEMFFSEP